MVVKLWWDPDVKQTRDDGWLVDKPSVIEWYDDIDDEYSQQFLLQTLPMPHTHA